MSRPPDGGARRPPVLVVGLDAADPAFVRRWAAGGHLPAIASVMARGVWGETGGAELVSEHGVWVSLASGISRGRHGYHYFRQLRPGTYELETTAGVDVAPPFWASWMDGAGSAIRTALVDVPDTRLVPGLSGVQLVNWSTHNNWDPERFPTASEPAALLERLRTRFPGRLVVREVHESTDEEDRAILGRLLEHTALKGALCREVLGEDEFDLMVAVFGETHAAGHQLWRHCPLVPGQERRAEGDLAHGLRDVYAAVDREVGSLLERFPEANVVLVSTVGLEDDYPTPGLIDAFCRRLGYQAVPEAAPPVRSPLDVARRLLPEGVRLALSRRLSRERRERLLSDAFRAGTDWGRTTAFSVPASYTSFVRVNQRGREPAGIVEPGREREALLTRIERDLGLLVDPADGQPAVTAVRRAEELFGTDRHAALPDLFVEWKPGRFMDRVVHPRAELRQEKPEFYRRSDHSDRGYFAAAGPSIEGRGRMGAPLDVLDFAPTVLALLGRPPGAEMTGRAAPWVRRVAAATR